MKVKLEDVCRKDSSNLKQADVVNRCGSYPVFGASGQIGNVDFYHQDRPYIAVVKDGAGIGRTTLCPARSSVIGTMQYLLPKENVLPEYLYYVVRHMNLGKYFTGATIPHIYFRDYRKKEFKYVPLHKQMEIVNILSKLEQTINMRQKELQKLYELVKARFVEMFGDPELNPFGWVKYNLQTLTSKIGSGATPKGGRNSYISEGISLVRSMNVYKGYFDYEGLAHITDNQAEELDNVTLQENDVLINITGASVARCCILPSNVLPARVNQHVAILRARDNLNPVYLYNLMINDTEQRVLLGISGTGGATREAITKKELEELEIPLPPITKQNQFADFVAQVDKSKAAVQRQINDLQELFDKKMDEYFVGERDCV